MDVGPVELLIVLGIVLLLFGSKKLPELAKGMGQAAKEFRSGLHDEDPERLEEAMTVSALASTIPQELWQHAASVDANDVFSDENLLAQRRIRVRYT